MIYTAAFPGRSVLYWWAKESPRLLVAGWYDNCADWCLCCFASAFRFGQDRTATGRARYEPRYSDAEIAFTVNGAKLCERKAREPEPLVG